MSKTQQKKHKPALTARQRKAIQERLLNLLTDLDQVEQIVTIDLKLIKDRLKEAKDRLDSQEEFGETESLTLQQATDRLEKFMNTLSNLINKIGETSSTITNNLK